MCPVETEKNRRGKKKRNPVDSSGSDPRVVAISHGLMGIVQHGGATLGEV